MLFRSPSETFNAQLHTEELSLTSQMDKHFAVHNTVLSRYERYCKFTSFLFHTGRINGGVRAGWVLSNNASKEVKDNAYRVQKRSLNIKPAISFGAAQFGTFYDATNQSPDMTGDPGVTYTAGLNSGTIVTNVIGSVAIKHEPTNQIFGDKFNPGDEIALGGGLGVNLWIQKARKASTGDHIVYDFKVIAKSATHFDEAHLAEDEVFMEGGNKFGEGSMKGFQRSHTTYWDIYYSFISRYSLSFTGNALDQLRVVWTDKTVDGAAAGSARLWQFEEEWLADEMFGIMIELACRFSVSSMDPSTHSWFENSGTNLLTMANMAPELGILPPRTADGWVRQLQDTIDLTYDPNDGLDPYFINGVCNIITSNSPVGSTGNTIIVVGDGVGYDAWDTGMKRLMGWNPSGTGAITGHNTNIVMDVTSGQKVKLGFEIEAYYHKGNTFVFMNDELFSHPGLNNRNGGLVGTGHLYFLNVSMLSDGVSNFELFTRGSGRSYIKKYVDGLHSLRRGDDSSQAASGFDGAFCHYLTELFPIIYYGDTCCVVRANAAYAGGALAGNTQLGNFPTII